MLESVGAWLEYHDPDVYPISHQSFGHSEFCKAKPIGILSLRNHKPSYPELSTQPNQSQKYHL